MSGETEDDLVAKCEAKIAAAIEADEQGNLARAIQLLHQAQVLLSGISDGRREEEGFSYDRESIDRAIANFRRRQAANAGVVKHGVRYERG